MADTMRQPSPSSPVKSIDDVRPRQAKATLGSQSKSIRLTAIVKDALQLHYGSLKAAALSMTPHMDQGQLTRELQTGDFKLEKLDRLDETGKAFISKALHEAYGNPDPKAIARRLIREARARLDELAEVVS